MIARGEDRRAQIEATLANYPSVSPEQLEELLTWFRKEASSLDVALLASNEAIAKPYAQFRADHIDRWKSKDVLLGIAIAAVVIAIIAAVVWQSL